LFSTPPHGDAVTVGYKPESVYLRRTCTSLTWHTHRHTGWKPVRLPLIDVDDRPDPAKTPPRI
jgi:hypothetical protein